MKLKYNDKIDVTGFDNLDTLALKLEKLLTPGNIALSGGSTYLQLLKIWAKKDMKLDGIDFYPVDERVVDFTNGNSNWGNTYNNFLSKYNKNRDNHFTDPETYNKKIENITMDTIFLGVGDDGHTASLFSTKSVFKDSNKKVIASISPKEPRNRISLTGNYIISANKIVIILFGDGKDKIVKKILNCENLPITTLLKKVKQGVIYIHNPLLGDNHG